MLKNEDIICISSIDWDFIWQGHQEIMTRLARNGNRVLFVENTGVRAPKISDLGRIKKRLSNWRKGLHGIRKVEEGLYIYSPLVLPFPYLRLARFINRKLVLSVLFKWLKAVGFSEPIVWTFLPTGLSIDLIDSIKPSILIYYCIDSFSASSKDAANIKMTEEALLKRADMVFVTSEELFKYCSKWNKKVYYFPFGVNIENFKEALNKPRPAPHDVNSIKKPIVGYIGGIHKWIDFDLVRLAAVENKDASFVFCGPIQSDVSKIKSLPNVTFLGQKDPKELPRYVNEFDIALIPYRITEYTKNVYPTKLNEYLALGKRVISTDLPEVRKFNLENGDIVDVASSKEEFASKIGKALNKPADNRERELAINAAENNSWASKLEKMSCLIEELQAEKMRVKEASWKNNIIELYKNTKKKFIPVVIVLALAYGILFHTPFIWFLAEPLKVSDAPGKSDVIAIFGAGVGESGRAGQNPEERVAFAMGLYKDHYADKILCSSGYKYMLQEAQVMRALSILMGADPLDIVLDDISVNTRDMVMRLSELSKKYNWKNVILVSSPYHMLRVRLLAKKYMPEINVLYVPIKYSSYYERERRVRFTQIAGILHEYIAILYYKLMGYI